MLTQKYNDVLAHFFGSTFIECNTVYIHTAVETRVIALSHGYIFFSFFYKKNMILRLNLRINDMLNRVKLNFFVQLSSNVYT